MKILIAEDEKTIANSLNKNFIEEGYEPTIAPDGEKALELLQKKPLAKKSERQYLSIILLMASVLIKNLT